MILHADNGERYMKRFFAILLTSILIVSCLPVASFAVEKDNAIILGSVDKTSVKAGETVTFSVELTQEINDVKFLAIMGYYDKNVWTFGGGTAGEMVSNLNPTVSTTMISFMVRGTALSLTAGNLVSFTLVAKEDIEDVTETQLYLKNGYYKTSTATINDKAWPMQADALTITVSPAGTVKPKPTATGYSVSMGADQQVAASQKVRIPVTVASSEKGITGFNAYDMTFTYDPAALTLNTKTGDATNLTVEDNNGTVRVRRYGATQALGEALALDFTAKATATSTVKLTNAKFDLDANSINFDAPDAAISDADTVVNANNFTVTLPDAFTSDETRLVPNGGSFTFKPVDSHYTYTFTVKMGDNITEGLTFGADDTYTIENISGNVEVTCTGKTPKQYDVTYKIDTDVEQDVTKGPETVTYLNDYSFTVTPRAGYSYRVIYNVDNGDSFVHTVIAVPTANDDGTLTYTIPGKEIVGGVEIWIDANTESGIPVVFTGNGAEDTASGNAGSMGKNMPYYFTLNERESCDYTVTAYYQPLNTPTASKRTATVRSLGNGKYVVEAVNYNDYLYRYSNWWNLVVKVEKVSHSAEEVSVSTYLELNDKTMMLITVKGTPEGGKAFTYDGNTMYKVNAYGTDQYAWLVIVDKGQTLTQEVAAAKVAISAADNVVTITPSFDVNRTGKVDVNDAQLVYDMYNGAYSDFTQVSVEKFLRADVNATKTVDATDAVAIVNQFK